MAKATEEKQSKQIGAITQPQQDAPSKLADSPTLESVAEESQTIADIVAKLLPPLEVRIRKLEKECGIMDTAISPNMARNMSSDPGPWPRESAPISAVEAQSAKNDNTARAFMQSAVVV